MGAVPSKGGNYDTTGFPPNFNGSLDYAVHPYTCKQIHAHPEHRFGIEFKVRRCRARGHGFEEAIIANVPPALHARGVKAETWYRWMELYEQLVVPHAGICCATVGFIFAWMLIIPGIIVCAVPREKYSKMQKGVKEWIRIINSELPDGLYCQPQTMEGARTRDGKNWYPVYRHVLSFALTKEEAAVLQTEEYVYGEHERGNGCCAPDRRYRIV
mmetsp:Transcript_46805/g.120618  ORF Transcript_46805/g.120618 Transcript_46805/m.120618 type:complete len:214 (-) Transcript_46805:131-772(-)